MKHTPGPWKFLAEIGRVEGGVTGESMVAFIAGAPLRKLGVAGDYPLKEMRANGRLIAAAPEMLEALLQLMEVCRPRQGEKATPNWAIRIEYAEAAIRKARGEQ